MTNNPIQSIEYENHTINIYYDESAESPRIWSNLGTFVTSSSRYNSPDIIKEVYRVSDNVGDLLMNILHDISPRNIDAVDRAYEENYSHRISNTQLREKYEAIIEKHAIILRVYKYAHGDIEYRTSPFPCPWDSGHTGYIYAAFDKIRKEYGCTRITKKIRERVIKVLTSEVNTYSKWANGEVYGYTVEDEDGKEIDSCWGFIGQEHAIECAKENIEHTVECVCRTEYFVSANI